VVYCRKQGLRPAQAMDLTRATGVGLHRYFKIWDFFSMEMLIGAAIVVMMQTAKLRRSSIL
jgi:hypothetical protein